MKSHLCRLFRHMEWADERVYDRLRHQPRDVESLRLFAHLLAAEAVWLERLEGRERPSMAVWPALSLNDCLALGARVGASFRRYLEALDERDLDTPVRYRTTKGRSFSTTVCDILTHVAMHGSYHRGQIALQMRRGGREPIDTDYITYVRGLDAGEAFPAGAAPRPAPPTVR
jgi:uncharacterized damage-inducible protein DinB